METEALTLWTNIFCDNILQSYKTERKELKIISMLITALQFELRNVHEALEQEIAKLNSRLTHKDDLKEKVTIQSNTHKTGISSTEVELKSPDIFKNESLPNDSLNISVIDLSKSEEDVEKIENSPTLISKRKKKNTKKVSKQKNIKRNVLNTINDNSVIVDCTPEVKKRTNASKTRNCTNKSSNKNITLTQLFTDMSKSGSMSEQKSDMHLTKNKETSEPHNKDNDVTEMGITQLLSFINKDTPNEDYSETHIEDDMNSSHEVDEFSKGILFDNSQEIEPSPKKKMKILPNVEPVVRGHARKLLKGFSCVQCKEFYGSLNMNPEELQKRLDACSNHRYKYQPPDDTYPGIWDMTIPEENVQK